MNSMAWASYNNVHCHILKKNNTMLKSSLYVCYRWMMSFDDPALFVYIFPFLITQQCYNSPSTRLGVKHLNHPAVCHRLQLQSYYLHRSQWPAINLCCYQTPNSSYYNTFTTSLFQNVYVKHIVVSLKTIPEDVFDPFTPASEMMSERF